MENYLGALTKSLEQAVRYLEESSEMTAKLKKILVPNILQFVALIVLLVVGTIVAIPMIQNVFEQVGSTDELPAMTMWFKGVLDKLIEFWYIPTFIIISAVVAIYVYIRTPHGKYNYHYLKNGMRVQESLETSKTIANNLVMLSLIEASINNILIGQNWIEPFEQSGLSTPMVTEMLKIGMQTDLAEMMEKLLDYMDIEINNIIERVMKVLPQIVYAIVGVMLIFVTIVVLVPLINVYMGTWLFSAYL